ncbi:MAG: glycosyltransferase family protein [Acidobacteriaceae bacterium]
MAKRAMFYCQHVLGMGHLVRSTEVVKALARDFSVLFVIGGEIPDGFYIPEKVQTLELPPLKTDSDFSNLQSCDSSFDLEQTKTIRRELLLRAFDEFLPDVLITELFPFGRKQFSFELLPLLERAHGPGRPDKTLVACSLRDILVARKDQQEYEERVCKTINSFYDLVLVHADSNFQKLEETFLRVGDLHCPVAYTGYVVQETSNVLGFAGIPAQQSTKPTIVVSNGSGQAPSGHLLLESVLRAASLLQNHLPHQFQVFAGPFIPNAAYQELKYLAGTLGNVTLAKYTHELPAYLQQAEISISMAGYNTIMDILSTGVRALVYPFTGGGDQEQTVRAEKMAKLGVLCVLNLQQLAPDQLASAILETLCSEPIRIPFNDRGAANSSSLLREHLAMRSGPSQFQRGAASIVLNRSEFSSRLQQ